MQPFKDVLDLAGYIFGIARFRPKKHQGPGMRGYRQRGVCHVGAGIDEETERGRSMVLVKPQLVRVGVLGWG